ncbi:unnamed protein product, partial [Hapterophycus canaliculatus]
HQFSPLTDDQLQQQRNQVLAEASPLDPVWGIGLRADNPTARTPALWPGQNLLGRVLMAVRTRMLHEAVAGVASSSL